MKFKSLLLVVALVTVGLFTAKAEKASMFTYDKVDVNNKMKELNLLDEYISKNPTATLEETKNSQNIEIKSISNKIANIQSSDGPLGIPSFVWGFTGGCIGGGLFIFGSIFFGLGAVLVVYLITQDSDETKKALIGCIVGTLVGTLIYIVFWVAVFGYGFFAF